jgi:hypothetical protein
VTEGGGDDLGPVDGTSEVSDANGVSEVGELGEIHDAAVAGDGGGGRPTALALRRLRAPEHGGSFWTDLDARLADEPQLRLAPRAAIRPITQPPPVIDDRHLAKSLAGGTTDGAPPRRSTRPVLTALVVAVVTLLALGFLFQKSDGDDTATGPNGDSRSNDTSADTSSAGGDESTTTTLATTTVPPGTISPTEVMDPQGVGALRIGATFADLQAQGFQMQPDMTMFRTSGGTCFEARASGALDLRLRFRNADGTRRANDPSEGVLGAISIAAALPTPRVSNGTGIGLGSPQDQVLAAYGGNLDERRHPFAPQGKIYRADAGNGLGIGFETDGAVVIGMSVGQMDMLRFVNQCR